MSSPRRIEQRARAVRAMARVRWFGVVFALFQVLAFPVPYPDGFKEAALALTGLLAVANLAIWWSARTSEPGEAARLALPSLVLDLVVLIGFVFVYTFDPGTSIWAIIYVAPLEGALLYQRRGALITMTIATISYTARELVGASLFDNEFMLVSITFRMGIGFMIAAVAGATSEDLVAERDRVAASEERLDAILRNSRDAIVVVDRKGLIRYASSATEGILGFSPGELTGREAWTLLEDTDRTPAQEGFRRMMEEPRTRSTIARSRHSDGRLVWLEIMASDHTSDPAIRGVLLNVHDVTERMRAQDELAKTNQRLTNVLANLPGMAYRCANDREWTMQFISDGVRALTGYAPEALLEDGNVNYADLIHPEDLEDVWTKVQSAVDRGEVFQLEYRIVTASGHVRWVWEQGRAVTPEGNVLEGLIIDATERKGLETALAESQKMEAIGRLAGGIAHDFNNLLSVVINYADLLLDTHGQDEDLRDDVVQIRDAGVRGAALVRQLLAFSRADRDRLEAVVVSDVLTDMLGLLRRAVGEGIAVDVVTESDRPVLIDRTKLEQVLLNLVVNARDAIADSGRIRISTQDRVVVDGFRVTSGWVDADEYVLLTVADDGCGIPPEAAEHVFEPFFTTKPIGQGTGLGLATVYGIVQGCGGHIDVSTEVGSGSTFSIYLPITTEPAAEPPVLAALGDPDGRREETILVVEDEEAVRSVVERILRGRGHQVLSAADGWQALELLGKASVDLLITDVGMPGLTGPALVEQLQARDFVVPVIYMSGYDDASLAKRGLGGLDALLLRKPFAAPALIHAVSAALAESQP